VTKRKDFIKTDILDTVGILLAGTVVSSNSGLPVTGSENALTHSQLSDFTPLSMIYHEGFSMQSQLIDGPIPYIKDGLFLKNKIL
jgi:hypothetical protein